MATLWTRKAPDNSLEFTQDIGAYFDDTMLLTGTDIPKTIQKLDCRPKQAWGIGQGFGSLQQCFYSSNAAGFLQWLLDL